MRQLHARGYLGRRGGTVEPGAFTLQFRKLDVYYRWIPKNSCTAIKRTLVGFEDAERSESFSTHNFHAEVQDAYGPAPARVFSGMESAKAIAVVREPLERVVSCYLDKFSAPTVRERGFERFAEGHLRRAQRMLGVREDLSRSISFAEFVWYLTQTPVAVWDPHWKPQWTYFGDDQDLDGYELFSMGDTAQIWSYLGVEHDNRRYNATAAGALDLSARTDDYSELLPAELQNVDQAQYQNFLPDALIRVLMPFFGRDYDIYNRAVAQGRSRRD
ncbi:hypothetical protein E4U02_14855 [Microbacterium paludicola]|uniref:Sulfotransferase family protein n=1 Tax=Microbacterium paludicola TaxID=300019 RepID=A0A4Y9FM88_9MICO|nr:sulfotransferase family 2 domain-containing protein [Microbacterium paludicola]MBF0817684.1 sulfotransferase family 2 domain-containing protein [Microbacterium paludicola]TFU30271.1 hypothetical protein E4U02_14855 [Microbacterium paludicola]